jgi:hypothetical protein
MFEHIELYDSIGKLPMKSADEKMRPTEVVNTETLLRLDAARKQRAYKPAMAKR